MKKLICTVLALLMILSLCACGKKETVEVEEEREPKTVGTMPIPFDDPASLVEAMTPVAFSLEDLKTTESWTYTLDVDIYAHITFSGEEVNTMHEGDRFFDADGNEMQVESLEFKDSAVMVNGGLDNGGVTLVAIGDDYMQVTAEGYVAVFNTGTATYPISSEFTLVDNADPENQEVTVTLEGLYDYLAADSIGFTPNNTTLEIVDSQITRVIRNYLP